MHICFCCLYNLYVTLGICVMFVVCFGFFRTIKTDIWSLEWNPTITLWTVVPSESKPTQLKASPHQSLKSREQQFPRMCLLWRWQTQMKSILQKVLRTKPPRKKKKMLWEGWKRMFGGSLWWHPLQNRYPLQESKLDRLTGDRISHIRMSKGDHSQRSGKRQKNREMYFTTVFWQKMLWRNGLSSWCCLKSQLT